MTSKQKHREAALKSLERREGDPSELEIYGCLPCSEYPMGVESRAVQCRDPASRRHKPESVKQVDLIMLPFGRGKMLGSE